MIMKLGREHVGGCWETLLLKVEVYHVPIALLSSAQNGWTLFGQQDFPSLNSCGKPNPQTLYLRKVE